MQKRFNEYFAKVILENCFPNKFQNIEVSDKPDLRYNGNKIGIEVAYCMPKDVAEAFNCIGVVWHQDSYGDNMSIEKTPIRYFLDMVRQKVDRLNSKNADYAEMESYELFINSSLIIPDWFKEKTFESLKSINNGVRKYDVVYLRVNDQKIFVYNLKENKYEELLYGALDKFAKRAVQLRNGET